jgi:hypothetical protein
MDKKKNNILEILKKIKKNQDKSISNSQNILNQDIPKSNLVLPINYENKNKSTLEIISLQLNSLAKKYKILENNIKDNNITIKELISDNVSKYNYLSGEIDALKKSITDLLSIVNSNIENQNEDINNFRPQDLRWELVTDLNGRKSYIKLDDGVEQDLNQALSSLYTTDNSGIMLASFPTLVGLNPLSEKVIYSVDNGLVWNLCGSGDSFISVNGEFVADLPLGVTNFISGLGSSSGFIFAAAKNGIFWSTNEGLNWKRFNFTVNVNDFNREQVILETTSIGKLGMSFNGRYLFASRRDSSHIYKFDLEIVGIDNNHEGIRIFRGGRGRIAQFITNKFNQKTYFLCDAVNQGRPVERVGGIYTNNDNNMNNWEKIVLANNNPLEISGAKKMIVTEDANSDIYVGLYTKIGKYDNINREWNSEYITSPPFSNQAYIVGFISNEIDPPYICNSNFPFWIEDEIENPENNEPLRLQPNLPLRNVAQPNEMVHGNDGRIYLGLGTTGNVLWRSVNVLPNNYLPPFRKLNND